MGAGSPDAYRSGLRRHDIYAASIAPGSAFCDDIDPADYEGADVSGEVAPDTRRGAPTWVTPDDMRAGMQVLRREDSGDDWAPVEFDFEFNSEGLSRVWTDSVSLPGEFAIVYNTEALKKAEERMFGGR